MLKTYSVQALKPYFMVGGFTCLFDSQGSVGIDLSLVNWGVIYIECGVLSVEYAL